MSRLILAELLKVRTTRLWWGLLLAVVGLTLVGVVANAVIAGMEISGQAAGSLDDPATIRRIYTAGVGTTYLFTLALGVISMAGEFRHQTITATLLATPRRTPVVPAKAVCLLIVGFGYGLVSVLLGVLVGAPIVALRGGHARLLGDGVPRAIVLAAVAVALWGLIGLGVGTLIRNQIIALLTAIGVAFLAEPLLSLVLNAVHAGRFAQYLPTQATAALTSPAPAAGGLTTMYLPWWAGGLVLLAYAVIFGTLGAVITLRRDVT